MHENMILAIKNIWGEERKVSSIITVITVHHSGTSGEIEAVLSLTLGLGLGLGLGLAMTKRNLKWSPSTISER